MKIQDMILPFLLALATTWLIHNFFFSKKDTADQYRFNAPESAVECKPLNKNIVLAQEKKEVPTLTIVPTDWATLEFSTEGASISSLSFKRKLDGSERILTTVYTPENEQAKEDRAFMVGLANNTPYYFKLVNQQEDENSHTLTYRAHSQEGTLIKTFIVNKKLHKIDLSLTCQPNQPMQVRLFFPAPFLPQLKEENNMAGDVIERPDVFVKLFKDYIKVDEGFVAPYVFGAENKYFIHAMVQDENKFAQRAYYKLGGSQGITAIIESEPIDKETTFNLSFYMGPKELSSIEPVDVRLEQAMDYSGWWAPISRILLKILNWLYSYVHNYGFAIILLTVLICILLIPFSIRAEKGAKDRSEMQKRLQYIQQKYKNDPEARAKAQAEFMQKHGLGLGGCLPMLLQLPIFFGLSRVLASSIELYKAPFLWIPDLSASDPYYILPALVMVGLIVSALVSTDANQRLPMIAMGLAFGAISASLSAGLVLYIAFGSILNLVQTHLFKWLRLA